MIASIASKLPCNAGLIKIDYISSSPAASVKRSRQRSLLISKCCATDAGIVQDANQVEFGIMCEPCGGRGWIVCDFCKGQKTNVKAENKRIYRRCPSCRAIGFMLCSKCKVFKCVTFPGPDDGVDIS